MQCTVEYSDNFARLSAAVKIFSGLEIQSLPKCPFLFRKIDCLTKVDVLGTWEACILFTNWWCFFFCFILGYPIS